jgi:hypothetical protein
MIIPKEHLDKVDFYTVKYQGGSESLFLTRRTVITFHYKKWYKLPRRFVFKWTCIGSEGWTDIYQEPELATRMVNYLQQYFYNRDFGKKS